MLKEVAPFERVWLALHGSSYVAKAIVSFIKFLERHLGAEFIYDQKHIGYQSLELAKLFELAETLRTRGIIQSYGKNEDLSDEPRIAFWYIKYLDNKNDGSAGVSMDDHPLAFTKALAEAIERRVWTLNDRFASLKIATTAEAEGNKKFISPQRFAGYSISQREKDPSLTIKSTDSFTWVKGYSWVEERQVWIPLQIVSVNGGQTQSKEPRIRATITTGIATHPLRIRALLSGALEVIERDAYIITWLNQLSPPRIDIDELSERSKSLAQLIARCRRYRLLPHVLQLPTDAPTYAVCAVIEDATGTAPRFSFGTKADRDPAAAAEGALLEALRTRIGTRRQFMSDHDDWDPNTPLTEISGYKRMRYWSEGDRMNHLSFLIQGEILPLVKEEWDSDTDEEHFSRIIRWCRKQKYELVSVSYTDALDNLPGWHIEFVVIPELQPLHYSEKLLCLGGERLKEIPRQFGYPAREPYLSDPHPFV